MEKIINYIKTVLKAMYTLFFLDLMVDFIASAMSWASRISSLITRSILQPIIGYLSTKPVFLAIWHALVGLSPVAPVIFLLLNIEMALRVRTLIMEHLHIIDPDNPDKVMRSLLGVVVAVVIFNYVVVPLIALILHYPVHSLVMFGLGYVFIKLIECHREAFESFLQESPTTSSPQDPLNRLSPWLANFKSMVFYGLLCQLSLLMITSSGFTGAYQIIWAIGTSSANVLWSLQDLKQMRANQDGKEKRLFLVDAFAKLGILFTAFRMASTTSMGVLPAFTAMQLLYALPKFKESYVYPNMCSQDGKGPELAL